MTNSLSKRRIKLSSMKYLASILSQGYSDLGNLQIALGQGNCLSPRKEASHTNWQGRIKTSFTKLRSPISPRNNKGGTVR